LYDYAWFVGFGASFITHYALMKLFPPHASLIVEAEQLKQSQAEGSSA
jgi:cytosine/uracil/thiamine/allantoin permease